IARLYAHHMERVHGRRLADHVLDRLPGDDGHLHGPAVWRQDLVHARQAHVAVEVSSVMDGAQRLPGDLDASAAEFAHRMSSSVEALKVSISSKRLRILGESVLPWPALRASFSSRARAMM